MSWNDLKVEPEYPFISVSIVWVQAEEDRLVRLGEVRNSKKVWRWVEEHILNRHHQLVLSIACEGKKSFFCFIKGKEFFIYVFDPLNQNAPSLA